jgi:hypothetical protein
LRMIDSSECVSSVGGTVHDPAFMNEVARQLRSLNVLILMPEIYCQFALASPRWLLNHLIESNGTDLALCQIWGALLSRASD